MILSILALLLIAITMGLALAHALGARLSRAGRYFFGWFAAPDSDWRHMRNAWDWSHVARAALATLSFLSMALALVR